jgi:hypothetical protein
MMADTIMAMLIASASVEINMVSPFASIFACFACSTPQLAIWFPEVSKIIQNSEPGGPERRIAAVMPASA